MRNSLWITIALSTGATVLQAQETVYKVPPIYPPRLERPGAQANRDKLPKGALGAMPGFDGDNFHINLPLDREAKPEAALAQRLVLSVVRAIGWQRDSADLQVTRPVVLPGANQGMLDSESKRSLAETERRVSGKVGRLSESTRGAIRETTQSFVEQSARPQRLFLFDQRLGKVRIEHSGVQARWIEGRGFVSVSGRVFSGVEVENAQRLSLAAAVEAARRYVGTRTRLAEAAPDSAGELVLLPYGKAMRLAWRVTVAAEEGSYRLWIDAADGRPLELEPQFAPDAGGGLSFNPNPDIGTLSKSFEVDPKDGSNNFRLRLSGVLDVNNNGADGVTSGDVTSSAANFDVSPLNGTAVDRTGTAGYNSRFQEINAYAWVYSNIQLATGLGSQTYPSLTVTVNHNNPCGFGTNNACGGSTTLTFGIGTATTGTGTAIGDLFNSAIDATVVSHEWAHSLTRLQFGVSGGTFPTSIDEGLSDFWAATIHNTDTFGRWWARNNATAVQTGFVPRQAEALDVFPEHRSFSTDGHADGQIIDWALWGSRVGLNNLSFLGTLVIDHHLVQAEAAAGVGVANGGQDQRVHNSFLNLLQQVATQVGSSRHSNKVLAGFARAGITLSERDAIIDISDDYLDRTGAPPTFTVFSGRDFQFNATEQAVAANVFNNRFVIEVANDAGFASNLRSSGTLAGIAVTGNIPQGSWTIPAADWNVLKAGDFLFYRVTTTDAAGGNSRSSTSPGGGFIAVDPPRAVINNSGTCECNASATEVADRSALWIMAFPLGIIVVWRRRLRRPLRRSR